MLISQEVTETNQNNLGSADPTGIPRRISDIADQSTTLEHVLKARNPDFVDFINRCLE